jgi:hypothetical protein
MKRTTMRSIILWGIIMLYSPLEEQRFRGTYCQSVIFLCKFQKSNKDKLSVFVWGGSRSVGQSVSESSSGTAY